MNLDVIQVADPCTVDWNAMSGDERVRHCGLCEKNVYDLSTLSRVAAEALIEAHEGRLCVRFYRRADGTVQTSDCQPIRQRLANAARRTRQRVAVACTAILAMAGLSTLAARLAWASTPQTADREQLATGGIAVPSTLPTAPPYVGRTVGIVAEPSATQPTTQPMFMGEIAPLQKTPNKQLPKSHSVAKHPRSIERVAR